MASKGTSFLNVVGKELDRIKADHPAWHADYEDIDPFVAERPDVERLLQAAPTEYARGLVSGILLMRQAFCAITGSTF